MAAAVSGLHLQEASNLLCVDRSAAHQGGVHWDCTLEEAAVDRAMDLDLDSEPVPRKRRSRRDR